MNTYGYVRVSTQEQNEERQMAAMRQLAIPKKNLFMDKRSGADHEERRPALHQKHRPAGAQL